MFVQGDTVNRKANYRDTPVSCTCWSYIYYLNFVPMHLLVPHYVLTNGDNSWRKYWKFIIEHDLKKLPFSTGNISIFRTKTRDSKGMAMFNCDVTGLYQLTPVTPMGGGWVTFLRWRQPSTMWVNRCKCLHQRIIPSFRIWAYVVHVPCVITNCDKKYQWVIPSPF